MACGGELDRRSFLVTASAAGGGLALGFAIPFAPDAAVAPARAADSAPEVTCWVSIAADDSVTIRIAHAEMGQGAQTGLAMLVAEDLECDWAKVRAEFVSPSENLQRGQIWGDTSTGASRSIASSQTYLRRAGAIARDMLLAAAAARWNVPVAQCTAANQQDHPCAERAERHVRRRRRGCGQDRAAGRRRRETAARLDARRHGAQASRCAR